MLLIDDNFRMYPIGPKSNFRIFCQNRHQFTGYDVIKGPQDPKYLLRFGFMTPGSDSQGCKGSEKHGVETSPWGGGSYVAQTLLYMQ